MQVFLGFSLYYFSLSKISLSQAVTLFFVSPFFVTISSKFIIGEKIGPYRWSAIFIGFLGVYLVLDPYFSNFNFTLYFQYFVHFLCLNSCYSKKTSDRDSLFTQIIHTYFSAIIFSIIIYFIINNLSFSDYQIIEYSFILRSWDFPSVNNFLILFIIGITGVIIFFSIFGAYVIGSPSSIAPYEYSLIIWSIIIDYMVWNVFLSF